MAARRGSTEKFAVNDLVLEGEVDFTVNAPSRFSLPPASGGFADRRFGHAGAVVIGRVHALEGGGTKSGWQAANRRVRQDLDASVWPFKTKLRNRSEESRVVRSE